MLWQNELQEKFKKMKVQMVGNRASGAKLFSNRS